MGLQALPRRGLLDMDVNSRLIVKCLLSTDCDADVISSDVSGMHFEVFNRRRLSDPSCTHLPSPRIHSAITPDFAMSFFKSKSASSADQDNRGQGMQSEASNQSQDQSAQNDSQSSQNNSDMGGGGGVMGSGVAGGHEGNSGNQAQTGEKKDWLDQGISAIGTKAGVNIVSIRTEAHPFMRMLLIAHHDHRAIRTLTPRATSSTRSSARRRVSDIARATIGHNVTHYAYGCRS